MRRIPRAEVPGVGGGGALAGPPHGSPGAGGFGAGGGAVSGGTSGTTGGAAGTFGGYGQRYIVNGWANGGGGGGLGGAIFNYSGSVVLENVSLLTNSATGASGTFNDPVFGSDGQRAGAGSGVGGAIFNYDGTVSLKHVTAHANTVATGATTPGVATGGAIYNYDAPGGSTPAVTIYNSILANSIFTNATGADVMNSGSGTIAASGAANTNLLETTSGTVTGTFLNVDPQLSLPGRYSGKLMILPFLNSPVLNIGDAANSFATDERGVARPANGGVDLGAAEGWLSATFTVPAGSLLVCDTNADAVFAVDPANGDRTLVSKLNVIGTGPDIGNPRGIVVDTTATNAYVVDTILKAVVKIDLTNGNRTVVSTGTGTVGGTGLAFSSPSGIALRSDGTLLVTDTGGTNGSAGSDAGFIVDPATGNRTILTDDVTPDTTNALTTPRTIFNHSTLGVLVADSTTTDTITRVNGTTGTRTIFSSNSVPNGTNPISNPQGLAEDADGSILLIEQNGTPLANRQLLRIDATTGARTVVSNLATVDSLTVVSVNDVPVSNAQSASTNEDTAKAITLTASDADSDPLAYSIVAPPLHGTLTGTPPNVTYTPTANYNGADSFTFKANDATADSNIATVSLTVVTVNDVPVATAQSVGTSEDTATAIVLTGGDADNDPITFTVVAQPTRGSLTGSAPNVTYTPAANFHGADFFTFKANDGTADSSAATVSIAVAAVNDVATLAAISDLSILENASAQTVNLAGIGTGAQDEIEELTITATSSNTTLIPNPTVNYTSGATGSLGFQPATNANGTATITVTVNDGQLANSLTTRTFTVTVTGVN